MNTLLDTLNQLISHDAYFLDSEGNILREKVKTAALQMDEHLLSLLLADPSCQSAFFKNINGISVFDKSQFLWTLNNAEFLPSSFTRFKNKIGLIDSNNDFLVSRDDVVLSFPYKDCILEFDATDENEARDEVFLNELLSKESIDTLLAPKAVGNMKIHTSSKPSLLASEDYGLVIKGNNLMAMYSLLPKYAGQVKLMYWDILYNTNNDKVPYNDSFKHSSWLLMMKNRLEVAYRLLSPTNGFMVVQCDKNEDAYLTVLMDEIFGRENHVCTIAVKSNNISGNKTAHKEKTILKNKDSILVYSMSSNPLIIPQYTEKTKWDTHYNLFITKNSNGEYVIEKLKDVLIREGLISASETIKEDFLSRKDFYQFILKYKKSIARFVNSISPELKQTSLEHPDQVVVCGEGDDALYAFNGSRISFLENAIVDIRGEEKFSQLLGDLWTDIDFQNTQNEGGVSLPAGKKPEFLLFRILSMFTKPGDLVLDAYFGSGTTGAVAIKMGRRFIGIEQLDSHYVKSIQRLEGVIEGEQSGISKDVSWIGGGSFTSCELLIDNQRYIERIAKANSTEELVAVFDELLANPCVLNYNINIDDLVSIRNIEFSSFDLEYQKKILIAVLDKNTLYINKSDIDDVERGVSEEDVTFTRKFYGM